MPKCYKCKAPTTQRACLTTSANAERRETHPEGTPVCDTCIAELEGFLQKDLPGATVVRARKEVPNA